MDSVLRTRLVRCPGDRIARGPGGMPPGLERQGQAPKSSGFTAQQFNLRSRPIDPELQSPCHPHRRTQRRRCHLGCGCVAGRTWSAGVVRRGRRRVLVRASVICRSMGFGFGRCCVSAAPRSTRTAPARFQPRVSWRTTTPASTANTGIKYVTVEAAVAPPRE